MTFLRSSSFKLCPDEWLLTSYHFWRAFGCGPSFDRQYGMYPFPPFSLPPQLPCLCLVRFQKLGYINLGIIIFMFCFLCILWFIIKLGNFSYVFLLLLNVFLLLFSSEPSVADIQAATWLCTIAHVCISKCFLDLGNFYWFFTKFSFCGFSSTSC